MYLILWGIIRILIVGDIFHQAVQEDVEYHAAVKLLRVRTWARGPP